METKNSQQSPRRKRKLTRAAKAAYTRATVLGVVVLVLVGLGVFGISRLVRSSRPADNESLPAVTPPVDVADVATSSSVKVLAGTQLENELSERITKLSTVATPTVPDEPVVQPGASGSGASTPPATPVSTLPATFDPASVGGTGASNIAGWKAVNADVRGWLKIPNTNINFPVVVGPDNLYYNNLGYYKEQSKNGVIWADSDTKFGSRSQISQNTVLYGHNWTNISNSPRIGAAQDVMFAQLTAFHHLNFAKVTPYVHYSTEGEEMTWKVFAAFYTDVNNGFNYIVSDPGTAGVQNLINQAKSRSRHNYNVDVNSSDKILTLSTCTRAYANLGGRQRFVVMARLLRPGETISAVEITANANSKAPTAG